MERKKILVVGSSNTDLVIQLKSIPRPGETLLGGRFSTFPGGKGANQAVAAVRAGAEVAFVAAVGDDDYGKAALQAYRAQGINTSYLKVCRGMASGVALISIASSGENAIAVAPGANNGLHPADLEQAEEAFGEADIMLVQLETPLDTVERAIALCAESGTKVILNPAPAAPLPDSMLTGVDYLTPNESEAEGLSGIRVCDEASAREAAGLLHQKGVSTVIITMGAGGAYCSAPAMGLQEMIPGFAVEALDTTAAGDTFNGQLAVALAEGMGLREAIRRAHAAAALSVQKLGAQSSVPERMEIDEFLTQRKH
ncbi:MAG: ribokinase [Bacteroidetes bacterium]|nr:MAG: ribokinase [Bacteroidota bacterium]